MYDLELLEEAMIKEAAAAELLQEAELLKIAAAEGERQIMLTGPAVWRPERAALFMGALGTLGALPKVLPLLRYGTGRERLIGLAGLLGTGAVSALGGAVLPRVSRWLYGV
jgi:hypothetical protein